MILNFLINFQITLDKWSSHVFKLRDNFPTLNFFTTDQLVFLSSELANLIHLSKPLSVQAIMLLKMISPSLNGDQLADAVEAFLSHDDISDDVETDDDVSVSSAKPSCVDDVEEEMEEMEVDEESDDDDAPAANPLQDFARSATFAALQKDFDKELIFAAMVHCGHESQDDVMEWCMDHSDDDPEDIQEIVREFVESCVREIEAKHREPRLPKKSGRPTKPASTKPDPEPNEAKLAEASEPKRPAVGYGDLIKFAFETKLEGLLSERLKTIWNQFLEKIESLEILEFLSFQTLAKCLKKLASKHSPFLDRKVLSAAIQPGRPNLVVCPDGDMHAIALSLYMVDEDKPMPRLDEVLICKSDTPVEHIELICRRAFNDQSGKIFVVMHAETMNYDNGMYIEQLFKTTTARTRNYCLVFLASKEKNDQSYIVTAFEKYRVQLTTVPPKRRIQEYLLSHLKSRNDDLLKLTLVKSKESGNGKSLVVQRMSEQIPNSKRRILQLHDSGVNFTKVISVWKKQTEKSEVNIFHLDMTPAVREGRADLVFSLAVLRGLADQTGQVWMCPENSFCYIELTSPPELEAAEVNKFVD